VFKKGQKSRVINSRRGYKYTYAVNGKKKKSKKDSSLQFRYFGNATESF